MGVTVVDNVFCVKEGDRKNAIEETESRKKRGDQPYRKQGLSGPDKLLDSPADLEVEYRIYIDQEKPSIRCGEGN